MFNEERLKVRANILGFVFYVFAYGLILQPACVYGYFSEFFNLRKTWGTK
jgi:biofilm PGA synthesis N-glycosyltransferase PgaC